ncbi:hypothetical protein IU474_07815 [Nocardia otitidiscaviarum]|nr:hypothetical protein [Nocardia otitidiscaviarum]
MFDNRLVHVETITAELSVTQPREIALYGRMFTQLSEQAVYGESTRRLIMAELEERR